MNKLTNYDYEYLLYFALLAHKGLKTIVNNDLIKTL